MTSLGEQLKAQETARKVSDLASQRAVNEAERKRLEKQEQIVIAFIDAVKESITQSIETNYPYKAIKVPDTEPWYVGWPAQDHDTFVKKHRHSGLLKKQIAWFDENDLKIRFSYQHDGVGINSWWVVEVTPK